MAGPYYGTNATIELTPNLGDRVTRGAELKGDLSIFTEQYTLVGTEAADEILRIHRNRPGMRLVPHLSAMVVENPGTALVVDIGDGDDADKYADGLTVSAGGTFLLSAAPGVHQQEPVWSDPTGDQGEWVIMTFKTATALTAGQKIRFELVYATNT